MVQLQQGIPVTQWTVHFPRCIALYYMALVRQGLSLSIRECEKKWNDDNHLGNKESQNAKRNSD